MRELWQDLRFAGRTLRRTPGYTLAALLVLALGIGANTSIFTVVNTVLLQPLPLGNPERLVRVWHTPPQSSFPGAKIFAVSEANFLDW
jgi:putative ABC transport system permease protein